MEHLEKTRYRVMISISSRKDLQTSGMADKLTETVMNRQRF